MASAYTDAHFNRETKEVTFVLADAEFPQRATLGVLQRIEARYGPAMPLIGRLARQEITIAETAELLGLMLRDHKDVPKKDAMVQAIMRTSLIETMGALTAFVSYGLASDMPANERSSSSSASARRTAAAD